MGKLIGNQKRIDLNKNGRIDAEDLKLLRSKMNGAWRNEHKHVNHNQDHEVRYARKKPSRTGYKGKRDFALGGSLENHGLKKGDRIIKTIDGGIQEVKDKDGNTVYVNLANGERSATIPLPFNDGGHIDKDKNPYQKQDELRKRYELLNDMYSNEDSEVDYGDILKVGDIVFGDGIDGGFARIEKEVNDPEKGDYFVYQDRYNDKFAIYVVQSVRDLRSKELFLQNVGISQKDFLYSDEVIKIYKDLRFHKGRVKLYEKNPNDASNYHGIDYNDYMESKSKTQSLQEYLSLMLRGERRKFSTGGKVDKVLYSLDQINYNIEYKDKDGEEYSEEFDTKDQALNEIFKLKKLGYIITSRTRHFKDDGTYNGSFKDGGEVTYFVNKDGIRVRSKVEPKEKLSEKEWMAKHSESKEARAYKKGGKVTFKEKARAIARNFVGKSVEPKYQKEYGKTYDVKEAKEVGNKIAGAQKAKYDAKAEKGAVVKKKAGNPKMKEAMVLAKKIRKDGEKWTDAVKRAYSQLK